MISTLTDSAITNLHNGAEPADGSMRAQVWGLLSSMYPVAEKQERRRQERFPYPRLVHLTPVAADGETPLAQTLVVAGKHISERGLGFYHPTPLPYRLMIASLEKSPDEWLSLLLDVTWCRFSKEGWYESGGRFLRCVAWQLDKAG